MISALKQYEKWQEILREHFICNAEVGERIYFYLAPTELKALASENDLTLHSLFNSVRWILFGGKGEIDVTYFEDFSRKTKRRNRKSPPPVLPILVCMTLAAEEMRTDNGVRSTNYYGRLAQLIDNDLNPKSFEVLKAQIRNKSAWFAELWKEGLRNFGKNLTLGYPWQGLNSKESRRLGALGDARILATRFPKYSLGKLTWIVFRSFSQWQTGFPRERTLKINWCCGWISTNPKSLNHYAKSFR